MTYILKKGDLFVIGYDLTEEEGKLPELTRVTLSKRYAMRMSYDIARIISDSINAEALAVEDSPKLEELNKFFKDSCGEICSCFQYKQKNIVNTFYEVLRMKKIMYLSLLGIMLLAENRTWLGIFDLYIDNEGKNITNEEISEIENVNVKFRVSEIFENVIGVFSDSEK